MNTTTILSVVVALIIGTAGGYVAGSGAAGIQQDPKELQDAVLMMNAQSASIKQMGEMMKTGGMSMQEMGVKYKDNALVEGGKDLQAVGEKYLNENVRMSEGSGMKHMMTQ